MERNFKKNKNTEVEIEIKNRPNCYDFKPLTIRYITIHRVFVGHFSLSALSVVIPLVPRAGFTKKVLQIGRKSGSGWPMSRRSSLRGDFGRVKTRMGLERFEVEKSRF